MSGVGAKFHREGKVPHTEGGDPARTFGKSHREILDCETYNQLGVTATGRR